MVRAESIMVAVVVQAMLAEPGSYRAWTAGETQKHVCLSLEYCFE